MKRCPKCKTNEIRKSGFNKGKQRYECKKCSYHFSINKIKGFSKETKSKAIQLYLEGLGLRAIGRIIGVSQVSVMNWVKEAASSIPTREAPKQVEIVEADEMCITVGQKNIKFGYGSLFALKADEYSPTTWVIVTKEGAEVFGSS